MYFDENKLKKMNIIRRGMFILMCVCFLMTESGFAQSFPDFNIRLTNGKVLSSNQVSLNKPKIIIVFSPDCGHCTLLMNDIFKNITSFKKTHLIMATFVQNKDIINFEKKYKTANYPNITVGTDMPVFFLQKYYKLTSTPFTVLYDKNRKLITSYKSEKIIDDLIKQVQVLNRK